MGRKPNVQENDNSNNELQEQEMPQEQSQAKTLDLGYNSEYIEYSCSAEPIMELSGERHVCVGWNGSLIKPTRFTNIRIEDHKAEQLNRGWFNRKLILIKKDSPEGKKATNGTNFTHSFKDNVIQWEI